MSDPLSVRLHLRGVRVLGMLVDSVDRLVVEVESAREWSRLQVPPFCLASRTRTIWRYRSVLSGVRTAPHPHPRSQRLRLRGVHLGRENRL